MTSIAKQAVSEMENVIIFWSKNIFMQNITCTDESCTIKSNAFSVDACCFV